MVVGVVIAVVLLGALGGGGYWYYQRERWLHQIQEIEKAIALKKQQEEETRLKAVIQEARVLPPSALGEREITGKDGAPMALVQEGEFLYGDDNQRLSLSAFYIDKYEVTTNLYAAFLQATSWAKPADWNDVSLVSHGDRPVVGVDWNDADAYCRHYGKRLPTEQEWEKAARGTDGRQYPWGNEEPSQSLASYDWDGKRQWQGYATLATVESYEAGKSPYGIYNMAGNVWEWTSSDYDSNNKVLRGGSWANAPQNVRSALRAGNSPTPRDAAFGFRCAQDAR